MKAPRPFWKRRLLPVFLGLLVLNAIGLVAWTLPQGYKQRNAARRVEQARLDRARERAHLASLRESAAAIRANATDRERFYRALAGGEDAMLFLEAVEAMARGPGLRPGARRIAREPVPETPLERVRFTLPLEGSYAQLVGFLKEVEASERFITVDDVTMRATAQQGAALQVQLSAYMMTVADPGAKRGGHAQ